MFRILCIIIILVAINACAEHRSIASVEEQNLIDLICTDPFVEVQRLERRQGGHLRVYTIQGNARVSYDLKPGTEGNLQIFKTPRHIPLP